MVKLDHELLAELALRHGVDLNPPRDADGWTDTKELSKMFDWLKNDAAEMVWKEFSTRWDKDRITAALLFWNNDVYARYEINEGLSTEENLFHDDLSFLPATKPETPSLLQEAIGRVPFSTVLVQHDWARLLEDSKVGGKEGGFLDFFVPFDFTAFNFGALINRYGQDIKVSLVAVLSGTHDMPMSERTLAVFFEKAAFFSNGPARKEWDARKLVSGGVFHDDHLSRFVVGMVKAIGVMVEAGVADTSHTPAPTKLNKARAKKGKAPIPDFYTVNLAKRYRREPGEQKEYQGKVRLHFRRGHYATIRGVRTWRRWTLVGNPDLGFVDKVYRA